MTIVNVKQAPQSTEMFLQSPITDWGNDVSESDPTYYMMPLSTSVATILYHFNTQPLAHRICAEAVHMQTRQAELI